MTDFWRGKRVLVTGHTGFKGSWLSLWLSRKGASVHGLALPPASAEDLASLLHIGEFVECNTADIRDLRACQASVTAARPDVVFHLAAQALVRESYDDPLGTWSTNVMGTLNLLHALHEAGRPCSVVVATTDKVYQNSEWAHAYRETDPLGGHDPYSASKAAVEILVASEKLSFLERRGIRVATARAGNVIGGGDRSAFRLVPDIVRAFERGAPLEIRNPQSVRPWQHVLDPLHGYLRLAEALVKGSKAATDAFNFGPDPSGHRTVADLAAAFRLHWPGAQVHSSATDAPHEAALLKLATEKARSLLRWHPVWDFEEAVARTAEAYQVMARGEGARKICESQITAFESQAAA